ncbi:MAG: response regulator [Pseudomonadota bacterium]
MRSSPHILIVEDDNEIADLVARFLRANGLRATVAANGKAMDRALADTRPDLVVLDLMLPEEDGLTIAKRLRATSALPIIMLTAMREETDRVVGLELGADDYLGKPFSQRELLARIRAVLRRAQDAQSQREIAPATFVFAGWRLYPLMRELKDPQGGRVALTSAEFDLLQVFCERPRRILNRDQLLDMTRGRNALPYDRSIDTLVSRIRGKIERDAKAPELLKTVRLSGYLFTPEVTKE